jgi:PAS domain S-box-containing protein
MRRYIARLLDGSYQVEAVADGEAALRSALRQPPDLVLSDVMMPRLDGFGLLRELRAAPATRELPVILLSARAGEESRIEGMGAGADDYLIKPFSARELLARVEAHLRMARLRREASEFLRISEERFRSMANTTPAIIWAAAPDGTITFHNQRWLEYTGITAEQNARDWPAHVLHPDDRERCVAAWSRALEQGTEYEIEVRNRRHDGQFRWFLTRATPIRDAEGRVVEWHGSTTDIHDRKTAEEALEDASRRKDEFLAILAHELRNPLAPIRNAVELLRRADNDPALRAQARGLIERQLQRMVRLIEELLDISRITRGKVQLHKERLRLDAAMQSAIEATRPAIEANGHSFQVHYPPVSVFLDADPTRLTQVFANLLDNAAKYTNRGGHVWFSAERRGQHAVVCVRDDGIGISAEHLPHVFEMFSQVAPPLERSQGGLGIGLALVRGLVELHGGTVEARSAGPGQGSEFIVRLPVTDAAPRQEAPPQLGPISAPRRRILIVDDNRDAADSLALMLRVAGHEAWATYDARQGVEEAGRLRPDVVLLDIGMPDVNGYEAARHIRAQPWGQGLVLIALTGFGQPDDKRRALEAGFALHLTKPVGPNDLERALASLPG